MQSLLIKLFTLVGGLSALFGGSHFTPQPHVNYGGTTPTPVQLQQDAQIDPYTTVANKLEVVTQGSLPEEGTVETDVMTDKPEIVLKKWNGEVALGITSLDVPANTTGSRPLLSKDIEWQPQAVPGVFGGTNDISMEAVPLDATTTMEDGGEEININLASEPVSNVFTFQLSNYQNLDFFYQAPLWQEAGIKGPTKDCSETDCNLTDGQTHRDDTVVGSYAVYYKDHANHLMGSTNYATGKAYHIFRPQVTDANGQTIWADLLYTNGVLTVTVPQSFLDSAVYPVKVDPTFGYTTVGATHTAWSFNRGLLVNPYTASAGDTVTQYNVHGACLVTNTTAPIEMATYSIVSGKPNTRLDTAQIISVTGLTPAWFTSSIISVALSAGTTYDIAMGNNAVTNCGGNEVGVENDSGSPNTSNGGVQATLPSTWSEASTAAVLWSIYATYTAGASTTSTEINTLMGGTLTQMGGTLVSK